jgi:hypothetical protein
MSTSGPATSGCENAAGNAAQPGADPDESFEAQRLAVGAGAGIRNRELTEDVARDLIEDLDLRQAAHHTASPER